jgi:hypothetical protein
MSTTATITITARDQASQAFQAIGKSAGGMSSSVQQSAKGFDVLKGAMAGLASSAVIGFLGDSARAAAESEASMARLQQAVENTGASFDELAPALNAAADAATQMAFDDEDAADALATLTTYTGDANQALDLLQVTMDIARGRGVDLATAATAVGKAAEGNVGALTRMGVAVAEGATASEALAAAQQRFAGQAEAYASTSAGAADRISIAWGNLKEEIGGLAGPLTGIISLLPGLSAGFSAVGSALGALKGAGGFSGLLAAINPVGLAVAGLAVTLGVVTAATLGAKAANEDYAGSFKTLKAAIYDIDVAVLRSEFERLKLTLDDINSSSDLGELAAGWMGPTKAVTAFNTELAQSVDATQAAGASLSDLNFAATKMVYEFDNGTASLTDIVNALDDYSTILNYTGEGQDIAAKSLADLTTEFAYGDMTAAEYATQVGLLADNLFIFDEQARKNAEATKTNSAATKELTSSIVGNRQEYDRLIASKMAAYAATQKEISAEERALAIRNSINTGIVGTASEYERYVASANNAAAAADLEAEAARQLQAAFEQGLTPSIQGVAGALTELVIPGEDVLDLLSRLGDTAPNIANGFADLVDGIKDSADGLDSILGVFKQIDQLGGRSQDAADIATGLVGDPGTYSVVNDLLNRGLITQEEYNEAREDEGRIERANVSIQDDLNQIRANQIGALADAEAAYGSYIDKLSQASSEEQLHAMYLMDSANQTKVATAYSTAYEATLGNIPKDIATDIIANAAMADPVLLDILTSYGLIEQGADGTITVTFPDASEQAVNRFESMFGEGNVAMTANGMVVVTDDAGNQMVYDQFGNLVDKTVKATIEVTLSHSSGLDSDTIGGILAGRGISAEDAGVKETSFAIIIESDITQFEKGLEEAQKAGEDWASEGYTAPINGDTEGFSDALVDATDAGSDFANTDFMSGLNADPTAWDSVLAAAMTGGDNWEKEVFVTNLDGNRDFFDAVVAEVDGKTMGTAYIELDAVDSNGDLAGTGGGGGNQLGGTVRSQDVSSVAKVYQTAANGRTVLVGEAGPELAFLPFGTQVMPSTPSRSRMAADGNGGGMRFYGPVHIHAASPDIAREIERQMTTRAMR